MRSGSSPKSKRERKLIKRVEAHAARGNDPRIRRSYNVRRICRIATETDTKDVNGTGTDIAITKHYNRPQVKPRQAAIVSDSESNPVIDELALSDADDEALISFVIDGIPGMDTGPLFLFE